MTDRQRAFVAHYLATLNAADAARKAGYSAPSADQIGYENLRKPEIAAAISAGTARLLQAADLSAQRTLEELRRLAFSDIGQCFDAQGNLLPMAAMSPEARACLASVKVVTRHAPAADGSVITVADVKLWDKIRALELVATYLGLLKKQIEHFGGIDLVARLQAARLRGRVA